MVRIYVVSELRLYRDAFVQALTDTGRVEVVGSASHPADALADLRGLAPQALLLDLPTPDGPWWAGELSAVLPGLRTLVLGLAEAETEVAMWAEAESAETAKVARRAVGLGPRGVVVGQHRRQLRIRRFEHNVDYSPRPGHPAIGNHHTAYGDTHTDPIPQGTDNRNAACSENCLPPDVAEPAVAT